MFFVNSHNYSLYIYQEFHLKINDVCDDSKTETITVEDIPQADYHDEFNVNYSVINEKGTGVDLCSDSETFVVDAYFLPPSILNKTEVRLTSKGESFPATGFNFSLITTCIIVPSSTSDSNVGS